MPRARSAPNASREATPAPAVEGLARRISQCRVCIESPLGLPLPHAPRPVFRLSATARLCVCSQAPGVRVHVSGKPFTDPSGDRLRVWLGTTSEEFYDQRRIAFVPMGFCFPGHAADGADLPPRKECARTWHHEIFASMPQLELILLVGSHAQHWHMPESRSAGMARTVEDWPRVLAARTRPRFLPLPHPSWRNNAWLARNPWFEADLLPALRHEVRRLL